MLLVSLLLAVTALSTCATVYIRSQKKSDLDLLANKIVSEHRAGVEPASWNKPIKPIAPRDQKALKEWDKEFANARGIKERQAPQPAPLVVETIYVEQMATEAVALAATPIQAPLREQRTRQIEHDLLGHQEKKKGNRCPVQGCGYTPGAPFDLPTKIVVYGGALFILFTLFFI